MVTLCLISNDIKLDNFVKVVSTKFLPSPQIIAFSLLIINVCLVRSYFATLQISCLSQYFPQLILAYIDTLLEQLYSVSTI